MEKCQLLLIIVVLLVIGCAMLAMKEPMSEGYSLGASSYIGPADSQYSDNPNYAQ
jgi:hypothetical protein